MKTTAEGDAPVVESMGLLLGLVSVQQQCDGKMQDRSENLKISTAVRRGRRQEAVVSEGFILGVISSKCVY